MMPFTKPFSKAGYGVVAIPLCDVSTVSLGVPRFVRSGTIWHDASCVRLDDVGETPGLSVDARPSHRPRTGVTAATRRMRGSVDVAKPLAQLVQELSEATHRLRSPGRVRSPQWGSRRSCWVARWHPL